MVYYPAKRAFWRKDCKATEEVSDKLISNVQQEQERGKTNLPVTKLSNKNDLTQFII